MKNISLLIKPSSHLCNMRCQYCFYLDLSEQHEVKNTCFMSEQTLETIVIKALAQSEGEVTFTFQGGEPTLVGLAFYEKLVVFQKEYNHKRLKINNSIQTNGYAIDALWADFFAKNNFLVGLSLDGTKEMHDFFRVDVNGKGTFRTVARAMDLLEQYGVDFNILTVVTSAVARKPEAVYHFYKKCGLHYLQFIPCLNPLGAEKEVYSFTLSPKRYGDFLCKLFDLWYRDFMNGNYISIRQFDNYILMLKNRPPEACGFSGVCSMQHVIEADGSVYPCDFYVLDGLKLGNLTQNSFDEINARRKELAFIEQSAVPLDACKKCDFFSICRGGCKRYKEPAIEGAYGQNVFCKSYQQFFSYAMPRMIEVAKRIR